MYTATMMNKQAGALLSHLGLRTEDYDRMSHRLLTHPASGDIVGMLVPLSDSSVRLLLNDDVLQDMASQFVGICVDLNKRGELEPRGYGLRSVLHNEVWRTLTKDGELGPISLVQYLDRMTTVED